MTLIVSSWKRFSDIVAKVQNLPYGVELRLYDAHGKKKRVDFRVNRKKVNRRTMQQVSDLENVTALLEVVRGMVSTDLAARRLKLDLFDPEERKINGNTLVGTVRNMVPKQTAEDAERLQDEEQMIIDLQATAAAEIIEFEHLIDDPASTVCSAFVRALVERYGRASVLAALGP